MDSELNKLIPPTVAYLSSRLPKLSTDWWKRLVLGNLSDMQRRWVSQHRKADLSELDLASLLSVLEKNWYAIAKMDNIPYDGIIYIREMKSIRNRNAHMDSKGTSKYDQYRDSDTQYRFSSLINADQSLLDELDGTRKRLIGSTEKEDVMGESSSASTDKQDHTNVSKRLHSKEYYFKLRDAYRPEIVDTVFILESPPVSGKYFYDESGSVNEPLFKAMMTLMKIEPVDKKEGLKQFQNAGYTLVDATYEPVNEMKGASRDAEIIKSYDSLVEELEDIGDSQRIGFILIKANVCRLLEPKLNKSGFNILNDGVVIPFPSTGQQTNFYREIQKVFSASVSDIKSDMWESGTTKTTTVGFVNRNNQLVLGHRRIRGTDHGQWSYKLRCLVDDCGCEYGVNGTDIFQRKCPRCQGGKPSIEY